MIENEDLTKIINIIMQYENVLIDIDMYKNIIDLEHFNIKHTNNQTKELKQLMVEFKTNVIKNLKKLIKLQNNIVKINKFIYYVSNIFYSKYENEKLKKLFELHKNAYKILNASITILHRKLTKALRNEQIAYKQNQFSDIYLYTVVIATLYEALSQAFTNLAIITNCYAHNIETNLDINLDISKYEQNLNEIKTLIYKNN